MSSDRLVTQLGEPGGTQITGHLSRGARWGSLPGAGHRTAGALAALLVLVGVLLRIQRYLTFGTRSLVRDEASLAVALMRMQFGELLRPLGHEQGHEQAAPSGFLLIEKAIMECFGHGELSLRLLSLIVSILTLPLAFWLMRRLLSPSGALVGLALLVLSEPLIHQGAFFKQYALDVFVTLGLLGAAQWALQHTAGVRRYLVVGCLGAAAVWFSHPAVFVLGGIGLTLILWELQNARPRLALAWVATMVACALSFGLIYFFSLRHYAGMDFFQWYWSQFFAPFPPRSLADLRWYIDSFFALFRVVGLREAGVGAAMLLFGAYVLGRDAVRWTTASLSMTPIVLTLVASALHQYPFGDRLLFFSCPLLVILIAAGVSAIAESPEPRSRALAAIVLGILFTYPIYLCVKYVVNPKARVYDDIKPTLSYVADQWREGDRLFVHWGVDSLYDFYVRKFNFRGMDRCPALEGSYNEGTQPPSDKEKLSVFNEDLTRLGGTRVWFLFSTAAPSTKAEDEVLLEFLDRRGKRLDEFQGVGSAAYLYEFGAMGAGGKPALR